MDVMANPNNHVMSANQSNSSGQEYYSSLDRTVLVIVMSLFIVLTLTGNTIMLWCIIRIPILRTINNVFLASLCFANLFTGCITMPLIAYAMRADQKVMKVENDGKFKWRCSLTGLLDNGAMVGFLWTLTFLSLDRFVLITYPIWYKTKQTKLKAGVLVFFVWLCSILLVTPPLFGVASYGYSKWMFTCGISLSSQAGQVHSGDAVYFLIFSILNSVLPIPLVVLSNVYILVVLLRSRKVRKARLTSRYRRSAILIIMLTSYLLLSLTPIFVGSYIFILNKLRTINTDFPSTRLQLTSQILFLGNGAITPIFFGFCNSSIRSRYSKMLEQQKSSLIQNVKRLPSGSDFMVSLRGMITQAREPNTCKAPPTTIPPQIEICKPSEEVTTEIYEGVTPSHKHSCCYILRSYSLRTNTTHVGYSSLLQTNGSNSDLQCSASSPIIQHHSDNTIPTTSSSNDFEDGLLAAWDEKCGNELFDYAVPTETKV